MSDNIEIVCKGGVLGAYEYEATYKGMTETLITSVTPDEKTLLIPLFAELFSLREKTIV